jgi:hypothetical protein
VRIARIALLALVALALAGCGGGGGGDDNGVAEKSADEIVADSLAAAKSADSVHVEGSISSGDQPISIDMHLAADKGAAGTVEIDGKPVQVVVVGDKAYLKAEDDFWEQFGGAAVAQLINGRWLVAPTSTAAFASFTAFTDIDQLFQGVLGDTSTDLEKGDETSVDGTDAIALTDPSKDGTLYVATEGEPYPLKIEGNDQNEGSISFTDWNEGVELDEPEDAVDISQFPGFGG